MPRFLKSTGRGRWIGSRGRYVLFHEAARFQGIASPDYSWPSALPSCFGLIGNTMSKPVLSLVTHA